MLPDLTPVRSGQQTVLEATRDVDHRQLPAMTNWLFDEIDTILAGATDADVVQQPHDPHLQNPDEHAWTLGHVVVHLTAGAEESAAVASTLARGAPLEGRPRYEVPWESVTTIRQVRDRLRESRRICLGFLQTWPDQPHLDQTYTPIPRFGPMNAVGRHIMGLGHGQGHLAQLREIMRQARG